MPEVPSSSSRIVRIPVDPQARLRAALRMIETRLAQQRASILAWRESVTELSGVIRDLRDNAVAYQSELDALASRVVLARDTTGRLDGNLDRSLAAPVDIHAT